MTKKFFAVLLLLWAVGSQLSALSADEVVRLKPVTGSESEYSVAELLRVELIGDSIRFIGADGTSVAEVYKYDYVQLTIADTKTTAVEQSGVEPQQLKARKVVQNGQVYILLGDKLYNISGNKIK